MPITPEQVQAAKALLGWTSEDLAKRAALSLHAVNAVELGHLAQGIAPARVLTALLAAGVEFTHGGRPGVQMKAQGNAGVISNEHLRSENDT
jgi:DNA-binding XRE family transcriptional regulator